MAAPKLPIVEVLNEKDLALNRPWQTLQIFNLYRLYLITILVGLFFLKLGGVSLGQSNPHLFLITLGCYFIQCLLCIYCAQRRYPGFKLQIYLQVICDIVILTLIMHTSGGVNSGLGILINTAIAAGSIVLAGPSAFIFAIIACVAVLIEHWFTFFSKLGHSAQHIQLSILSASFFATATFGHTLSKRLTQTEALATRIGLDLANLQQLNEHIIQRMRSGILVVDSNERIYLMNESARHLLLLTQANTSNYLPEISPELAKQLQAWKKDNTISTTPFHNSSDGPELIAQFASLVQNEQFATMIFLDNAARTKQQLQQLKLASLGRLTASIAHEIRNPLAAISHAAQLMQEGPPLNTSELRLLEIIQENSERMNDIIRNVLQLSRRDNASPSVIKLNAWLEEFIQEFMAQDINHPQITLHNEKKSIEVFMDASHLRQVMTNLCENGLRYSMRQTGKPTLLIQIGVNLFTEEPFLDVIDQGPGVAAEHVTEIFEPFFTTENTGTGLGLYIAKELCEANQARLDYLPQVKHGGCFRISFRSFIWKVR